MFGRYDSIFTNRAGTLMIKYLLPANVRTLGLVEVFFAQIVTRKLLSEATSKREITGMTMILIGVGALLLVG